MILAYFFVDKFYKNFGQLGDAVYNEREGFVCEVEEDFSIIKKMNDDYEIEDKALGMRFCSECNNMLYPRENRLNKTLEFKCRHCDNREAVDTSDYVVYKNDIKAAKDIQWSNIDWAELTKDPTLPRGTVGVGACKNCGNGEVVYLQTGFGIIKENQGGMNLWLICTRCNHRWKNQL